MKKMCLLIVVLLLSLSTLFASEVCIGLGGSAARDYLTESGSEQLQVVEAYKNADFVYGIGPKLDIHYYPFKSFGLGLHTSLDLQFVTAIGESGYRSHHGDSSVNLSGGLSYILYFNPTLGLYTDVDLSYTWYSIAKTNEANIKNYKDFVRFQEYGVKGSLGFLTQNKNRYFSFGFSYDHHLSSKPLGKFPIGLFVAGGFKL